MSEPAYRPFAPRLPPAERGRSRPARRPPSRRLRLAQRPVEPGARPSTWRRSEPSTKRRPRTCNPSVPSCSGKCDAAPSRLTSQSVGGVGAMSTPPAPSRGGTTHSCYGGRAGLTADSAPIVVLDENELAGSSDYCATGLVEPSPDGRLLAYSVDLTGDEVYRLRFRDLGSGAGPRRRDPAHLLRRCLVGGLGVLLLHGPRRRLPAVPGVAARAGDRGGG